MSGTGTAALSADGPDQLGHEIAQGPAAVQATLTALRSAAAVTTLVARAERLVVVGMGASLNAARIAVPLWRAAAVARGDHRPIVVREASDVVFGTDGIAWQPGDLVAAISYRGSSPETVAAATLARRAGQPVVAVTWGETSALAGESDALLRVDAGDEERGPGTKSTIATVAALLGLGGAMATDTGAADRLRSALERAVADWEPMRALGEHLAACPQTWLIGLGAGEGVAHMAALLWHEKVLRAAVAMSPAAFRHGPIESTNRDDAVVVVDVASGGARQDGYLRLLGSELARLGCHAAWLGPDVPDAIRGVRLEGRGALGVLEATLRAQQLCRATALASGAYTETFRVLREIVRPSAALA